jgi:hypothetical protein
MNSIFLLGAVAINGMMTGGQNDDDYPSFSSFSTSIAARNINKNLMAYPHSRDKKMQSSTSSSKKTVYRRLLDQEGHLVVVPYGTPGIISDCPVCDNNEFACSDDAESWNDGIRFFQGVDKSTFHCDIASISATVYHKSCGPSFALTVLVNDVEIGSSIQTGEVETSSACEGCGSCSTPLTFQSSIGDPGQSPFVLFDGDNTLQLMISDIADEGSYMCVDRVELELVEDTACRPSTMPSLLPTLAPTAKPYRSSTKSPTKFPSVLSSSPSSISCPPTSKGSKSSKTNNSDNDQTGCEISEKSKGKGKGRGDGGSYKYPAAEDTKSPSKNTKGGTKAPNHQSSTKSPAKSPSVVSEEGNPSGSSKGTSSSSSKGTKNNPSSFKTKSPSSKKLSKAPHQLSGSKSPTWLEGEYYGGGAKGYIPPFSSTKSPNPSSIPSSSPSVPCPSKKGTSSKSSKQDNDQGCEISGKSKGKGAVETISPSNSKKNTKGTRAPKFTRPPKTTGSPNNGGDEKNSVPKNGSPSMRPVSAPVTIISGMLALLAYWWFVPLLLN